MIGARHTDPSVANPPPPPRSAHDSGDERDQGGFGHTPWGVGIHNRFSHPAKPSSGEGAPPSTRAPRTVQEQQAGWRSRVGRVMNRIFQR